MPARKFFAVPVDDLSCNKREKRQSVLISDDEEEDLDDFVVKPPKKFKAKSSSQMEEMHRDIQQISRNLECIFKLTKNTKLPPGLYKLLSDTFQCQICRAMPIVPPPIYTRCCKRILGCQTCVDRWYYIVALTVLIIVAQSVAVKEHLQKPVKSRGWMIF